MFLYFTLILLSIIFHLMIIRISLAALPYQALQQNENPGLKGLKENSIDKLIIQDKEYFSLDLFEKEEWSDDQSGEDILLQGKESTNKFQVEIPNSINPINYKLKMLFTLNEGGGTYNGKVLQNYTVVGSVLIDMKAVEDTKKIVLHTNPDILIDKDSILVRDKDDKKILMLNTEKIPENEFYAINLEESLLAKNDYSLFMEFLSPIYMDKLHGIYLSNYTDPGTKEKRLLATTQFEPISARRAFPSFDEPKYKTTFEITIGRSNNYKSLSNTKQLESIPIEGLNGWQWDNYKKTVKMSTYLVAFLVSDFHDETADKNIFSEKIIRTWAPGHLIQEDSGDYSAKIAANILKYYVNYFDIEYPLSKMDSASIPHFKAGAMENFGLNLYREEALLYTKNKTTEKKRLGITTIIAHELAHQNFGNLVTNRNWPNLWLNEGFATYVSYFGVHSVTPEFNVYDTWHLDQQKVAMDFDLSDKTHPIVNETHRNTGFFDRITYSKGASLLKMIQTVLGKETMLIALQKYLKKFAYENVVQDDLFQVFEDQVKENLNSPLKDFNLREFFYTWTLKSGFPLVKVDTVGNSMINFKFTQEKYVKSLNKTKETSSSNKVDLWWIPITIQSGSSSRFLLGRGNSNIGKVDFWMPKDSSEVSWADTAAENQANRWIVVNPTSTGYYRVQYDSKINTQIDRQLLYNHLVFDDVTRSKLIEDNFKLAFDYYIPIERALDKTKYLEKEESYTVWKTTFVNLKKVRDMLQGSFAENEFKVYFNQKLTKVMDNIRAFKNIKINDNNEVGVQVLLKSLILEWSCQLRQPVCIEKMKNLFSKWKNSNGNYQIRPDYKQIVFCTALANSEDEAEWNFVSDKIKEQIEKSNNENFDFVLLKSLACSRNSQLLKRMMNRIITGSFWKINKDDALSAFLSMTKNDFARDEVFDFIKNKNGLLIDFFETNEVIQKVLKGLSIYWNREEHLKKLNTLKFRLTSKSQNGFANIKKSIQENIKWMNVFYERINSWFLKSNFNVE